MGTGHVARRPPCGATWVWLAACAMRCGQCGGPSPEYFTDEGVQVCRVCYFAGQTAVQEQRALDSVEKETGVRPTNYQQAARIGTSDASPRSLMLAGVGAIGLAVVLAALEVVVLGSLHPIVWGAVLLTGVASLGRGLQLRR